MTEPSTGPEEREPVVIRDNRKIDPVTGEVRKPAADGTANPAPRSASGTGTPDKEDDVPKAEALLLEERTRDLQRVQAEYANYRKRADRERLTAGELAVGRTLAELLPVVDDIDRARVHGDLTDALKAVADKLDDVFAKLGLAAFGEVGDPFDPSIHEAVMHDVNDEVSVPTCTTVMRQGYQHHERLLRPAMVGVTDPATPTPTPAATESCGEPAAQGENSETSAPPHTDEADREGEPATEDR